MSDSQSETSASIASVSEIDKFFPIVKYENNTRGRGKKHYDAKCSAVSFTEFIIFYTDTSFAL